MALTKYTQDTSIIGQLGTRPEDRPGMTDQQLKDKFDENALTWKEFWNNTASEEIDALIAANMDAKVAEGTATALTVTLNGVTAYRAGMKITLIAAYDNNSADTSLKVNALAALPVYKPNTTTAPIIKAGKPYTFILSSDLTHFFIEASAEGNAVAANVLAGKTFSNDDDIGITGTMPNKVGSGTVIEPTSADQAIPAGYYGGALADGKVTGYTLQAGDNLLQYADTARQATQKEYSIVKSIQIDAAGVVRIKYDFKAVTEDHTAYAQIYKNGAAEGVERTSTTTSYITYTEDIAISSGDRVQLAIKSPDQYGSNVANFRCYMKLPVIYTKVITD